ncbi:cytochrome C553 [Thiomicrospira aerophila AL3]|uniref:Cytochrome C553 n=2 Tax=Thiomicrospira aerophila TaxID=92245 RepID=W0DQF6_9GAMM|nr:cytochrome C553 [Thiomicrospira aerophila AL3]
MKIKNQLLQSALIACLTLPGLVMAADAKLTDEQVNEINAQFPMPSGKMLGDSCAACHGTLGAEFNEGMPPLAGMNRQHFIDLMKAFRQGDFPTIVMHDVAYVYSDAEIEAMADYFASLPAEQWPAPNVRESAFLNPDGTIKQIGGAQ